MKAVTIIFPNQLFKTNPALKINSKVFIIEEYLFFKKYLFHKQKLVLLRASMKTYQAYLQKENFDVAYLESIDKKSDIRLLIAKLKKENTTHIHFAEVVDDWLAKRIAKACKKYDMEFTAYSTPAFLNTKQEGDGFFATKKKYFQTDFYIYQRKKRKILVDDMDQPIGGKWSFDADNRCKFPSKEIPPTINFPTENIFVKEAKEYVANNFNNNYGSIDNFFYPTNFTEAQNWLQDFLKNRFEKFGVYEDAIVAKEFFLNHSVLSPMINIGLLTPLQVVDTAINYAEKNNIALNSAEGFIRQIIGWREFIKIVYEREGGKQRTKNYWGFDRKIPSSFWNATTGIEPLDNTIKKLLKTGYNHHIERLMVIGNFMLLCEFDPDETYKWFMEMYVDSYDWVMVPNVYGMVQFADGGIMTTKPYISGSNYILKMSDYKKGKWCEIWDGLFWRFMHVHRSFFVKNPRLGMLVNMFDKMPDEKQKNHLQNAEKFLELLDKVD
jgi:deoxyribodipyrimidine photolyase-related protein